MTCDDGNRLRALWYSTAEPLGATIYHDEGAIVAAGVDMDTVYTNQEKLSYRAALGAYKDHRSGCEQCQDDWL